MLASSVVFAADAGHHVQEVDVAAAVGVAVALAVWTSRAGETSASVGIWEEASIQRRTHPTVYREERHL